MTKQTIIPAGYRLTVTSWENDGDNYNTEVKEGLSKELCAFYVDLCKLLHGDSDLSNLYEPSDREIEQLAKALRKIAKKYSQDVTELDDLDDLSLVCDQVTDILLDLGLSGGDYHTRVCESFKVEYIDKPIVLTDVTEEFK